MYWKKIVLPIVILALGYAGMEVIAASGSEDEEKEQVDTRPLVALSTLQPENYAVTLSSYGEVAPLETTNLSAQVAGEVVWWNPDFIPGGLVKRGEILFTIEKDAYEAALYQAEAALSSARAQLIQEQAQADVAKREAANMPDSRVSDLYLRKPQLLSAQAALKSAEAQLRIAKRDLANCDIRAPYDALVTARNIGTGDFVTTGTIAATLNNVEYAEISFPVAGFDQSYLPASVKGIEATVSIDDRHINAVLHRDLGTVDKATRMSYLVARITDPYGIHNPKNTIKFGSFATVSFEGITLEQVYKIPQELVNNNQVWLLSDDNTLNAKSVSVIRDEQTYLYVRGDIENGKLVVTPPEYPIQGMAVKVIEKDEIAAIATE